MGKLMQMAIEKASGESELHVVSAASTAEIPSVEFCHKIGLDYGPAHRSACRSQDWLRHRRTEHK